MIGALPRLVREKPTRDAVADRLPHPHPEETPDRGLPREGARENEFDGSGERPPAHHKECDAPEHVGDHHERHQQLAGFRDRTHPSQNHDRGQHGHDQPRDPRGHVEGILHESRHGVGLHRVPDPERGHCGQRGEHHPEPALFHAPLQHVHRAAGKTTPGNLHPVFHTEDRLGIFRRNAEDPRQPHPENGPRPARGHCGGDPDDVPCADRRRQCGHERPPVADVTLALGLSLEGEADSPPDVPLDQPETKGEEEMRSDQQDQHRRAPDEAIDVVEKLFEECHWHTSYHNRDRMRPPHSKNLALGRITVLPVFL